MWNPSNVRRTAPHHTHPLSLPYFDSHFCNFSFLILAYAIIITTIIILMMFEIYYVKHVTLLTWLVRSDCCLGINLRWVWCCLKKMWKMLCGKWMMWGGWPGWRWRCLRPQDLCIWLAVGWLNRWLIHTRQPQLLVFSSFFPPEKNATLLCRFSFQKWKCKSLAKICKCIFSWTKD